MQTVPRVDTRKFNRAVYPGCHLIKVISINGSGLHEHQTIECRAEDLSAGGMRFSTWDQRLIDLPLGQALTLKFNLPDVAYCLVVEAVKVNCRTEKQVASHYDEYVPGVSKASMGVRFISLGPETRQAIERASASDDLSETEKLQYQTLSAELSGCRSNARLVIAGTAVSAVVCLGISFSSPALAFALPLLSLAIALWGGRVYRSLIQRRRQIRSYIRCFIEPGMRGAQWSRHRERLNQITGGRSGRIFAREPYYQVLLYIGLACFGAILWAELYRLPAPFFSWNDLVVWRGGHVLVFAAALIWLSELSILGYMGTGLDQTGITESQYDQLWYRLKAVRQNLPGKTHHPVSRELLAVIALMTGCGVFNVLSAFSGYLAAGPALKAVDLRLFSLGLSFLCAAAGLFCLRPWARHVSVFVMIFAGLYGGYDLIRLFPGREKVSLFYLLGACSGVCFLWGACVVFLLGRTGRRQFKTCDAVSAAAREGIGIEFPPEAGFPGKAD